MCVAALCVLWIASASAAAWVNRRVADVLDELRGEGYTFIYSSQLVPPTMNVTAEPGSSEPLEKAREVLSAHGLALSQAAPRVFAVVRGPPVPATRATPSAATTPLEVVVVQTSRYAFAADQATTQKHLTQEQVKNMPRLADETLRAVQRLPGTASNGFSSLGPIRGGEPNEVGIILDGLRLYEPFHLKNFLSPVSLLDSRLIDNIEFYSGGFPAVYGDRMSAMVDATSLRPAQPQYYEAGLSLFHLSALASREFDGGRGRALLSVRRSNIGELAHYSENDFGEPHYADSFLRVDYRLNDTTSGALHMLASKDSISARRSRGEERIHAKYQNAYAWGTLDHAWSDQLSSKLIASFTELTNERNGQVSDADRFISVHDDRNFHIAGLRLENELDGGMVQHRLGAEIRRLWGQYDYSSEVRLQPDYPFPGSPAIDTSRRLRPDPAGFESSAYWDARTRLGSRWTVQGGLRIDTQTYDGSGDGEQWSPRLSLMYTVGPRTHVRASWGRFFQSQGINELQVEDGRDRFGRAQHADHAIVSLDHAFDAGVNLRLEAYRKYYRRINPRFENLFDPLVLFPEAEIDRISIDPDSARAEGIELLIRVDPIGAWSGWFSYALSSAQDRLSGTDVPRSWDQRHAINAGLMWARRGWTVSIADSYHSGWPTTDLQISRADTGLPQIDLTRRNRRAFNSYNTLDLRVTRTFALAHGALDVFVEANNALSRENICCVSYDVVLNADGTSSYRADTDSWLPLVPSAGVLWRY